MSFAIAETAPAATAPTGYPRYGGDHRLTSATTTAPKDTLISLGKFASPELDGTQSLADLINEPENTINFMPLAHVLARRVQLNCLVNGLRMAQSSDTHEGVVSRGELQKIQSAAADVAAKKCLGPVWYSAQSIATWCAPGRWRKSSTRRHGTAAIFPRHRRHCRIHECGRHRGRLGGRMSPNGRSEFT